MEHYKTEYDTLIIMEGKGFKLNELAAFEQHLEFKEAFPMPDKPEIFREFVKVTLKNGHSLYIKIALEDFIKAISSK